MTKRKGGIVAIVLAVLAIIISLFCLGFSHTTVQASAATTSLYNVRFTYTAYRGLSIKNANTEVASGTNVLESEEIQVAKNVKNKIKLKFQIYGSSYAEPATLSNGGYIGSSTVNIATNSNGASHTFELKNSSGTVIKSSTTTSLYASSLSDGLYTVSYSGGTEWKESTAIRDHPRGVRVDATFQFRVDTTKPTMSGASTSTTGKYVNTAFTVSGSDSGSGVDKIYWLQPGAGTYSSTSSSSKTITASSANGLYRFYTVDEVGNKSSTYYVYLDTVAPTGTFSLKNGNTIASGGSTKEAFAFSATDSGSGVAKIEYKKPSSSTWSTYTAGTEIQPTAAQGMYTFRVTDKASNTATYTITVADPCANGHSYTSKVTAPTCTAGGYTTYTCSVCGSSYKSNTTQALGHSYKATTTTGSCTEGGYTTYTCTRCGDSYTDNSTGATGHSYSATVTAPTCTSSGYTTFTCTRCGNSYTGNRTEALGHSYQATTASSSCTSGGYTVYKCTRCGVSYTDNPTEALGHSYVASIIEATCTERGYTIYTCTKCGDSYRDNETAAKGHNYVSEVVSATCTEGGGTVYTCTRCGESYHGSETGALGHAYETNTVAATCTEGGYTIHTCTRCGSFYKDNETQPLGHNYVTTTKEATCTEYGMTIYTCQICGDSHSDVNGVYPTGHNYSNFIVKAATCTQDGERRYVCDKCGDEYTEVIPAMGHNYAITDSSSENGITTRVYTCTLCGDSYTQELGDQYEEVSSYIEELFEQYRPYMWWVLLATAGIWSIVMGVFFAIAQKNEDKEKAKKMIVNYVIGLVVIFAILVACPYLIRGIAALIT